MDLEDEVPIGDWEVDTIFCKSRKQALVIITGRKSRLILMRRFVDRSAFSAKKELLSP